MSMTETEFDAANRREAAKKAAFPPAVAVRYDRHIGVRAAGPPGTARPRRPSSLRCSAP